MRRWRQCKVRANRFVICMLIIIHSKYLELVVATILYYSIQFSICSISLRTKLVDNKWVYEEANIFIALLRERMASRLPMQLCRLFTIQLFTLVKPIHNSSTATRMHDTSSYYPHHTILRSTKGNYFYTSWVNERHFLHNSSWFMIHFNNSPSMNTCFHHLICRSCSILPAYRLWWFLLLERLSYTSFLEYVVPFIQHILTE